MKTFFLGAAVILALCSSCETADEIFITELNEKNNVLKKTNTVNKEYDTYKKVLSDFVYNKQLTYSANVKRYESHVNQSMRTNEGIDLEQVQVLSKAHLPFINELNYSTEVKAIIYALLQKKFDDLRGIENVQENEYALLQTLFVLHNDNNGDNELDGKRTIAFAYGAQYNLTQAIMYAGAIELGNTYNKIRN